MGRLVEMVKVEEGAMQAKAIDRETQSRIYSVNGRKTWEGNRRMEERMKVKYRRAATNSSPTPTFC